MGATTVNETLAVAVKLPDFPVMVMVEGPVAAEVEAKKFTELLPDVTGLKVAVTPGGRPDADSVTAPVKPDRAIPAAALDARGTLRVAGVTVRVTLDGGVTVSAMVATAFKAPEVPVIVIVDAPAAAVLAAARVKVLAPDLTALKVAVTPLGSPDAVRVTAAVNPLWGRMAMVLTAVDP